jgi:hypothetical protein
VQESWLKLRGTGEWLVEKHGAAKRRAWRKLHIGDALKSRDDARRATEVVMAVKSLNRTRDLGYTICSRFASRAAANARFAGSVQQRRVKTSGKTDNIEITSAHGGRKLGEE